MTLGLSVMCPHAANFVNLIYCNSKCAINIV